MGSPELLLVAAVAAVIAAIGALVLVFRSRADTAGAERAVREESRVAREEHAAAARALREEVSAAAKASADTVVRLLGELREQVGTSLHEGREGVQQTLSENATSQKDQVEAMARRLAELSDSLQAALERFREGVDQRLKEIQEGNEKKLEEMRVTVDEKLQGTLERRLGESFKQVSERLEAVHRGLGDMQTLATGVGDLKRVLTNVKTRGVWGEYQLGSILEQILTPDQYVSNYKPRDDSGEVVEFAIRLPGRDPSGDPVFLPIDSKFPQEDYQRLLDAVERADPEGLQESTVALVRAVRSCARDISDKYIHPSATTDFGIMFLPTEGLYAEVLRQPGLVQEIQRIYSVVIAGPTTLSALLSSLRMGFKTLAIEQRSSEVWKVLGAVKAEFGKFGEVLDKVKRQLATASQTLESTGARSRAMERKLREVETLPGALAETVLGLSPAGAGAEADDISAEGPELQTTEESEAAAG